MKCILQSLIILYWDGNHTHIWLIDSTIILDFCCLIRVVGNKICNFHFDSITILISFLNLAIFIYGYDSMNILSWNVIGRFTNMTWHNASHSLILKSFFDIVCVTELLWYMCDIWQLPNDKELRVCN
jgi:hypothetical protein